MYQNNGKISLDSLYYDTLQSYEKTFYDMIAAAMSNYHTSLFIPYSIFAFVHCSSEAIISILDSIAQNIFMERPELFYIDFSRIYYSTSPLGITISWRLLFDRKEIETIQNRIQEITNVLHTSFINMIRRKTNIKSKNYQQVEFAKYTYWYLNTYIVYDNETNSNYMNQTIYNVFINRCATCGGISRAYKYLLNLANISCCVVRGVSTQNGITTENGQQETIFPSITTIQAKNKHCWNMIEISDNFFWVDVTWGSSDEIYGENNVTYDWFGVSDNDFMNSHLLSNRYMINENFLVPSAKMNIYDIYPEIFISNSIQLKQNKMWEIAWHAIKELNKTNLKAKHSKNTSILSFRMKSENIENEYLRLFSNKNVFIVLDRIFSYISNAHGKKLSAYHVIYNKDIETLHFCLFYQSSYSEGTQSKTQFQFNLRPQSHKLRLGKTIDTDYNNIKHTFFIH